MKTITSLSADGCESLNEDDIRDYAYHLYLYGGCVPGHDLENWLEAKTYLSTFTRIPERDPRSRDHDQKQRQQAAIAEQAAA